MIGKRSSLLIMAFLLALPAAPASAEEDGKAEKGSYSEKREVVYATLNADGSQKDMYVVNNFDIEEPGTIVDFGPYSSVENLTNLNEIKQKNSRIEVTAEEEEFYYQGNLEEQDLPWVIDFSYKLGGEKVDPEELLGKGGQLEIGIETSEKEGADPVFFNNYTLQITIPLDAEIFENIEAPDGTVASSGKDRQVTFTVLPEKEESFKITADAENIEMDSIEIAAVPASISMEEPDIDGVKNDMNSLADATAAIHDGAAGLADGITELNSGTAQVYSGSEQYLNGIQELNSGSGSLVEGSASIKSALAEMSRLASQGPGELNLGDLSQMQTNLRELSSGLQKAEDGLVDLRTKYANAHNQLDEAMASIPGYEVTEEDIQALRESGVDQEVVDHLIETYHAAQEAKAVYGDAEGTFDAAGPALDQAVASLSEINDQLAAAADTIETNLGSVNVDESIKELQQGIQNFSSQYNDFHAGLVEYTDGVGQLAGSYEEVHSGIGGLTSGTAGLESGASDLQNGTAELAASTSDLPDEMQSEIDQLMSEYDYSDFEPVSFVSEENENVESVQFVIKTESIKKAEQEEEPEEQDEKSLWDRFLDLFR
ncbi:YhgE/Pip domain-containing protein [Halobacillus sp. Cin3]|uniref:YhgE/Pip domain-containing protein n=1 Tax=Halobacillus sp. Cin3 TaxID=2928441 RepID=UPI00248DC1ED|nr:YhgE/Pip domain-containing protein [Halobacillus sp. Cin3]